MIANPQKRSEAVALIDALETSLEKIPTGVIFTQEKFGEVEPLLDRLHGIFRRYSI
jgi:hypothetical protein